MKEDADTFGGHAHTLELPELRPPFTISFIHNTYDPSQKFALAIL
jgi:hypothetical protein